MGLNDPNQVVRSSHSYFSRYSRLVVVGTGFDDNGLPQSELFLQTFLQIGENSHDGPNSDTNHSLVTCLMYETLNLLPGEAKSLTDFALSHVLLVIEPSDLD
jgi:hypothetical protein